MSTVPASCAPLRRRLWQALAVFGLLMLAGLIITLWLGDGEGVTRVHFSSWVQRHYAQLRIATDYGLYPFYFLFLALFLYGHVRGETGLKLMAQAYIFAQLAGAGVTVRILKMTLGRARPDATPLPGFESEWAGFSWDAAHHSFPSGHTADIVTSAVFMTLLIRNPWAAAVFMVWAVALALSRLALAKHYPSDALAGALIALMASYVIVRYWLVPRLERMPSAPAPRWWRQG
jgi:membrane-associated phospholipid phosphatase